MRDLGPYEALRALDAPRGEAVRVLTLGELGLRIEGLDAELAAALDLRWGAFLRRPEDARPRASANLRVFRATTGHWIEPGPAGERYRMESWYDAEHRTVVSYHFAICADDAPGTWRMAVANEPAEPLPRIVENAARYLVARLALDAGGFAMHAAGVLRDGRAWLFAGPSRSGKSTAVGLAAPAASLGDDFAFVLPRAGAWRTTAVPFDNSERIDREPPEGSWPIAGIWRLYHANGGEQRVERLGTGRAIASLMGCMAFPWTMPEDGDRMLDRAGALVRDGLFAHLRFRKDARLWDLLGEGLGPPRGAGP